MFRLKRKMLSFDSFIYTFLNNNNNNNKVSCNYPTEWVGHIYPIQGPSAVILSVLFTLFTASSAYIAPCRYTALVRFSNPSVSLASQPSGRTKSKLFQYVNSCTHYNLGIPSSHFRPIPASSTFSSQPFDAP